MPGEAGPDTTPGDSSTPPCDGRPCRCTELGAPHLERSGVVALADDGLHMTDIVEKPAPGTEPSRDASIGHYLYAPEIYPALKERWECHEGGEFNYTGGGGEDLARAGRVVICRMVGCRLDIGTPAGYLRLILEYASRDPDLAAEIESLPRRGTTIRSATDRHRFGRSRLVRAARAGRQSASCGVVSPLPQTPIPVTAACSSDTAGQADWDHLIDLFQHSSAKLII